MRYASLTRRIAGEGSDAWAVHDRAVARQIRGDDIILLSIGDPDFETPASIREAAHAAIERGRTHYSPSGGEPALLEAIAREATGTLGRPIAPANVAVFPGAQATLYALAQCLFDHGDEVVVVEPTYVTYEAVIGAPGATMVQVPLRPERSFHLDPDDLARAITPRTRALLLNFPHNPTGSSLREAERRAVAELCRRHDLWLVSDEVYGTLVFDGRHQSPAAWPGMEDRSVVVGSLSKSHAMTGWRCGWAIGPSELIGHLGTLARAMFFGVAQFIQDAAAEAVAAGDRELAAIRESYRTRAALVVGALGEVPGLQARMPDGGMYVFLDVRGTGLEGKRFAAELLDETGVAVTPGEGFGPSGAGHVRITLGTGEARLTEACRRIEAWLASRRAVERAGVD
ncbi:MAG: aminotransferase class I/II-fold pyridoxal phosphate-dependent enzyme [Gemmatimonadales bacterium]